jgi:hypothetical protein
MVIFKQPHFQILIYKVQVETRIQLHIKRALSTSSQCHMFSNIEQPFLCVYCGAIFIVKLQTQHVH